MDDKPPDPEFIRHLNRRGMTAGEIAVMLDRPLTEIRSYLKVDPDEEPEFHAFVRGLTCIVPDCKNPGEPHHPRLKHEKWRVPLCRIHHTELHALGWRTFDVKYHISVMACAILLYEAWSKAKRVMRNDGESETPGSTPNE